VRQGQGHVWRTRSSNIIGDTPGVEWSAGNNILVSILHFTFASAMTPCEVIFRLFVLDSAL
jgi:hypothetical protein